MILSKVGLYGLTYKENVDDTEKVPHYNYLKEWMSIWHLELKYLIHL